MHRYIECGPYINSEKREKRMFQREERKFILPLAVPLSLRKLAIITSILILDNANPSTPWNCSCTTVSNCSVNILLPMLVLLVFFLHSYFVSVFFCFLLIFIILVRPFYVSQCLRLLSSVSSMWCLFSAYKLSTLTS